MCARHISRIGVKLREQRVALYIYTLCSKVVDDVYAYSGPHYMQACNEHAYFPRHMLSENANHTNQSHLRPTYTHSLDNYSIRTTGYAMPAIRRVVVYVCANISV